jgi:hypothetical protein
MRDGFILVLLVIFLSLSLVAQDQSCAAITKAGRQASREFLRQQSTIRSSSCITPVIKRLGETCDVKAIPLLTGYLDYLQPGTGPLPGGGAAERPHYPAVDALFQIGTPATGDLLKAIQTGSSPTIQRNAFLAYLFVYRDDLASGIRILRDQAALSKTEDVRRRLNEDRRTLIEACKARGGSEAEACAKISGAN